MVIGGFGRFRRVLAATDRGPVPTANCTELNRTTAPPFPAIVGAC
jgi:hypothetical protein